MGRDRYKFQEIAVYCARTPTVFVSRLLCVLPQTKPSEELLKSVTSCTKLSL